MICKEAIDLIKHFESLHDGNLSVIGLQPKMDCVGIWTVGYGHALTHLDGSFMRGEDYKARAYTQFTLLTERDAEELLQKDLAKFERSVTDKLTRVPNDYQLGALVSLAYNIGVGNFAKSSVLKFFNAGELVESADAFLLWNKSGGRILKGLELRRAAERQLFLKD